MIKPEWEIDKCEEYMIDPVDTEALKITGISREDLDKAPSLKTVWSNFVQFVTRFNPKRDKWSAPILAGYNNLRYDNVIVDRICGGNNRMAKIFIDKMVENGKLDKKIRIKYTG